MVPPPPLPLPVLGAGCFAACGFEHCTLFTDHDQLVLIPLRCEQALLAFGPETEAATVEALHRHLADARAAWSGVVVSDGELATELGRRLGDAATLQSLTACRGVDVYLTIAGTAGDPTATRAIMELVEREVSFGARRTRATPDQAAEVRGELHRVLFTSDPRAGRAARCARARASP